MNTPQPHPIVADALPPQVTERPKPAQTRLVADALADSIVRRDATNGVTILPPPGVYQG